MNRRGGSWPKALSAGAYGSRNAAMICAFRYVNSHRTSLAIFASQRRCSSLSWILVGFRRVSISVIVRFGSAISCVWLIVARFLSNDVFRRFSRDVARQWFSEECLHFIWDSDFPRWYIPVSRTLDFSVYTLYSPCLSIYGEFSFEQRPGFGHLSSSDLGGIINRPLQCGVLDSIGDIAHGEPF